MVSQMIRKTSMIHQSVSYSIGSPIYRLSPQPTILHRLVDVNFQFRQPTASYSMFTNSSAKFQISNMLSRVNLLTPLPVQTEQQRSVTKFSMSKGKKRSVRAVLQRFYRLQSGLWIRPRAGRNKHKNRKSSLRNRRGRYHVFCSKDQCEMLDKMVVDYYKAPKFYVENIYEPYERRNDFMHGKKLGINYK